MPKESIRGQFSHMFRPWSDTIGYSHLEVSYDVTQNSEFQGLSSGSEVGLRITVTVWSKLVNKSEKLSFVKQR